MTGVYIVEARDKTRPESGWFIYSAHKTREGAETSVIKIRENSYDAFINNIRLRD
jgi:hypothetical protein